MHIDRPLKPSNSMKSIFSVVQKVQMGHLISENTPPLLSLKDSMIVPTNSFYGCGPVIH